MSAIIIDKIQTQPFTDSDTAAYIRAVILCDTVADLPGVTDFTDYILTQGSTAHVISTAEDYQMQSDGTWSLQQGTDLQSIITALSDIDDRLNDTTADATWAKEQIDNYIRPALVSLINRGAKNALDLSAAATATDNGVTFTVNQDSTITVTGQAVPPNNAWFVVGVTIPDGVYVFSGIPVNGGTSSFRQEIRATPRGSVIGVNDTDTGNTITISAGGATVYYHIRVASGYDLGAGITFRPMLSQPDQHTITDTYVPYAPTNRELLNLIRSYHP